MKILVTGRAGQLVSSLVERAQHDPDVSLVALGNFVSLFVLFSQTRAVSLANIEELTAERQP